MSEINQFIVSVEEEGLRLDKYLSNKMDGFSRMQIQNLIEESYILVNDNETKSSYKVANNDIITILEKEVEDLDVEPENIPLEIVYQDRDLIIINKKQGMVVHPGAGNYHGTLVNALLYHCNDLSSINGVKRPGIVHRLDKDTSGLIMVAKNDDAHNFLADQLKDKTANRLYYAIVHGYIEENEGIINVPIGRDTKNRLKMAAIKDGKEAITHFKVLERFKDYTFIECRLETGRTHQIRVHMAYILHPVACDPLYGPSNTLAGDGQYLHAHELSLIHPSSLKKMTFKADLPQYFKKMLSDLKNNK